jgi:hypothetical protein
MHGKTGLAAQLSDDFIFARAAATVAAAVVQANL